MNRQQRRAAAKRSRPPSVDEALRHHQAGRLDRAEVLYLRALAIEPTNAAVLYLLAGLRLQQGNFSDAIELNQKSLAANPNNPQAHVSLGTAFAALGKLNEAVTAFRQAVALKPDFVEAYCNLATVLRNLGKFGELVACLQQARAIKPSLVADLFEQALGDHLAGRLQRAVVVYRQVLIFEPTNVEAHSNLGSVLRDLGRLAEAEASYREALRYRPGSPELHANLSLALRGLGRLVEAEASCREALRLKPDSPQMHDNMGNALRDLGRRAEAEASYREALRLRLDSPEVHRNLGLLLQDLGRWAEAEESYREALRLRPEYPEAYNDLCLALRDLGRPKEAEASCREALRLRPGYPEAHSNLSLALLDLGRPAEAEASCREALRLRPDFAEAHFNLSNALLLAGRLEEGWREYEWRWKISLMSGVARDFVAPLWSGEAIGDRVILLHAEQGLGDTLQFWRYIPLIGPGAKIVLEVQAPLVRLLSRLPGIGEIVARGEELPSFDLHCPLLSLPRVFGTTLETIPSATPYLAPDRAQTAYWRARLSALDGLLVGLVWAGGPSLQPELAAVDRRRSIDPSTLAPLGELSGISLVSLQKNNPAAQTSDMPRGMALHDFTADLHDFADTAALVDGLDLVISVDTAVAHLAGALGKPVWLLNRFDSDWRWLLNRDDSPWYPTLRQFRQPAPGDWSGVIFRVRDALQRLVAGDRDQLRPRSAARTAVRAGA